MKKVVKKEKSKPETVSVPIKTETITGAEELFIPPVKSDRCLNCGQKEVNHFFYTRQCKPHSDARFKDIA